MSMNEDSHWQNLVALGAATCEGEMEPPYGFVTNTLARLRDERRQQLLVERIGMRALFASLGLLLIMTGLTFELAHFRQGDLEPGLRGILQVENVQIS